MRESIENCSQYASDIHKLKGAQREEVLLRLYAETAKLKAAAVWCVLIPFKYSSQVFSIFYQLTIGLYCLQQLIFENCSKNQRKIHRVCLP